MKLRIFVMIIAVSIAACGGGGSDGGTFSDSTNYFPSETENELSFKINDRESGGPEGSTLPDFAKLSSEAENKLLPNKNGKRSGKNPAHRKFIVKQDVAELVVRKTLDAYYFVDVGKPSQVRMEMHHPDAPHLQLRKGMEYLKDHAREEDDQLWSKKYAVATYIYVLNSLPRYNFNLPFERERAFLPFKKIKKEEIERAKRVIVFFRQKADGKCPEPIGLRYFEENDPEFNKNDPESNKNNSSASGSNGNQRGWYITKSKAWKALDSKNLDTQEHISWLRHNTETIDSLIYFKEDELNELEKSVRNLANEVLPKKLDDSIMFHEKFFFMD
ncbi:hypothetical protein [Mycoavidus sp. SF9855]|uniref:hypothetical protein n=1 Tax=Mycoavidus sp. SF9855 TaxID=2968475 RepID=UPI00211C05D0|nr:hypothetical protein [Mycoavidus sp. SF9855]UUM21720.1 hypothetical protein NQD60_00920 [Mycoavidus sp. SF9855]